MPSSTIARGLMSRSGTSFTPQPPSGVTIDPVWFFHLPVPAAWDWRSTAFSHGMAFKLRPRARALD